MCIFRCLFFLSFWRFNSIGMPYSLGLSTQVRSPFIIQTHFLQRIMNANRITFPPQHRLSFMPSPLSLLGRYLIWWASFSSLSLTPSRSLSLPLSSSLFLPLIPFVLDEVHGDEIFQNQLFSGICDPGQNTQENQMFFSFFSMPCLDDWLLDLGTPPIRGHCQPCHCVLRVSFCHSFSHTLLSHLIEAEIDSNPSSHPNISALQLLGLGVDLSSSSRSLICSCLHRSL